MPDAAVELFCLSAGPELCELLSGLVPCVSAGVKNNPYLLAYEKEAVPDSGLQLWSYRMAPDELIRNLPKLSRKPENLLKPFLGSVQQAFLDCCRKVSQLPLGLCQILSFSHRRY